MLLVFSAPVAAIVALTVLALRRDDPATMLERRLERGDIHPDEYQGRVAILRAIPEAP